MPGVVDGIDRVPGSGQAFSDVGIPAAVLVHAVNKDDDAPHRGAIVGPGLPVLSGVQRALGVHAHLHTAPNASCP
jgi:hypothetical protein